MNYQTDVIDRALTGTDAEIAAQLAASRLTVRDIPVASLRNLLRVEWRLLYPDPITGQNAGPIITLYQSAIPDQLKEAIARLAAHLDDPTAAFVRTATRPEYAAAFGVVVDLLGLSDAQHAALNALHGGEQYATVTADDVAASKAAYDAEQLRSSIAAMLNEAHGAAVNAMDAGDDAEAVKAAFDAAWGA